MLPILWRPPPSLATYTDRGFLLVLIARHPFCHQPPDSLRSGPYLALSAPVIKRVDFALADHNLDAGFFLFHTKNLHNSLDLHKCVSYTTYISDTEASMTTIIANQKFEVRQTGSKFFYFSPRATRWLPIAKSKVIFG